jgi:hypothetical protein
MKCPICKNNYSNITRHLKNHGYTVDEADRMMGFVREEIERD